MTTITIDEELCDELDAIATHYDVSIDTIIGAAMHYCAVELAGDRSLEESAEFARLVDDAKLMVSTET